MRKRAILSVLLIASTSGTFCQAPTLTETVAFLDRIGKLDGHSVTAAPDRCAITISSDQSYLFEVPTGVQNKAERDGHVYEEFLWTGFESPDSLIAIHLDEIDPSSIRSDRAVSPTFITKHHPIQPEDLNDADLAVVRFSTRDSMRTIRAVQFKPSADSPDPALRSMDFIIFHHKDHAEQFVTALTHAVDECGGKVGSFPPTPSTELTAK